MKWATYQEVEIYYCVETILTKLDKQGIENVMAAQKT